MSIVENTYNKNFKKLLDFIYEYGNDDDGLLPAVVRNHILASYIKLIMSSVDIDVFMDCIKNKNRKNCIIVERKSLNCDILMKDYCWGLHTYSYNLFNTPQVKCACILDQTSSCACAYQLFHYYFCINPFHYKANDKLSCDGSFLKLKKYKQASAEYLSLDSVFSYRVPNYTLEPLDESSGKKEYMLKSTDPSDDFMYWMCVSYYEYEHSLIYNRKYHQNQVKIVHIKNEPTDKATLNIYHIINPLHNEKALACRNLIYNGIVISKQNSSIFVTLASPGPIFIRSPYFNSINNRHNSNIVKVYQQIPIKIFNLDYFKDLVDSKYTKQNYEEVLNLASFCSLEISFIKGWGENYQRQRVNETPCWLHIRIIEALDYLDSRLKCMNGPNSVCHSTT